MAPRSPQARDGTAPEIALPSELLLIAESQWIFTEAELSRAPSVLDGYSEQKEHENRAKGVNFILQVGIMLKLPQITLSTASVFLHRFYMRHSMVDKPDRKGYHYYTIAAACLFLATKVEENCRKMRELLIACVRVAQKDPNKIIDEQDREYWRWKDNILHNEDVLMEALCFDFSLEPPYKTLFDLLIRFKEGDNKRLRNAAWAFINDSCMTVMCLLFPSRTIAASALYAAATHCNVSFPDDENGRAWWEIAGVSLAEVRKGCNFLADIYEPIQASRTRKNSISYEHMSEHLDAIADKTRAVREVAQVSARQEGQESNGQRSGIDTEGRHCRKQRDEAGDAANKHTNGTASHDFNRSLNEVQSIVTDGIETNAQSPSRRPRTKSPQNPLSRAANAAEQDSGGLVSPRMDDVSEEGELED